VETTHLRRLIILLAFALAGSLHLFLVSWLLSAFPRLRAHRRVVIAVAVLLFLTAPIGRLLGVFFWKGLASSFSAAGTTEWMTVMLTSVPLGVAVIATRIAERARRSTMVLKESSHHPASAVIKGRHAPPLPKKREFLGSPPHAALAKPEEDRDVAPEGTLGRRLVIERSVGLVAMGASASVLGWGSVFGRHEFQVEEIVVRLAGLPKALEGYTIAQISDIHAGLFVGEREIEEGFEKVRSLRPDLVVVTGDLVDFDARFAPWLARKLSDLRGKDGVVGILGNHDYYAGFTLVVPAMRAAGVDLLVNEGRTIRPNDGGGFALLGVDDLWAPRSGGVGPDLDRAIAMVRPDTARVLLAHQPSFLKESRGQVGLQLSGHTHGGQINPGFRPADFLMRYVSGRYEESGTTLWVNRGFGVAGPPSRIGAPPEVTKVVLVSA
jgi:predicted MPP superfamily phosphohydrolase